MLGKAVNPRFIELGKIDIASEIAGLIHREIAIQYCLIPFAVDSNKICIAMKDPSDAEAISFLRLICMKEILAFRAEEQSILAAIESHYEKAYAEKAVEVLQEKNRVSIASESAGRQIKSSENAPAVRITDYLINEAIIKGASDIHIEPYSDMVRVRYRTDGVLFTSFNVPLEVYGAVSTRIKIMGSMDISERRSPQDGKIEYTFFDRQYDLRISSLPTVNGEKFVIRILHRFGLFCNLKGIDFREKEYDLLKKILGHNHGMILVTGPTGSGKSTTLYAMLNELNNAEKNITTIEDPVEYSIGGVNQVSVNQKAKITFAAGLRSILRQDPDVIMIGEIRDEETAAIAVRAAITGHLVISTLHTNDAIGAIPRLIEMGVERYLLADCLIAVTGQRLVRKICENCKTAYSPGELERKLCNIEDERKLYKGGGCFKCNKSGYHGRCAVCEVLYIDDTHREFIVKNKSTADMKRYASGNMSFMKDNCRELVLNGITTYEELLKLSNGQ
jgi:type IV pilus assembly protein PilB